MYLQYIVGRDILTLGATPVDVDFVRQYNDLAMDLESDANSSDEFDSDSEDDDRESDDEMESSSDEESDLTDFDDLGIFNVPAVCICYSLVGFTDHLRPRKRRRRQSVLSQF